MSIVRILLERLLLLVFQVARAACLAQGLALGLAALIAVQRSGVPGSPPWLQAASRSGLLIAVTFLVAGVLLYLIRTVLDIPATFTHTPALGPEGERRPEDARPAEDREERRFGWLLLLALSLAALPATTFAMSSEFFALWGEILDALDRTGLWSELRRSNALSGLVLLPLMVVLFVPILEAAAAFLLILVPLGLLALLGTRSRLFPRLFVMMATCQAGLLLASLLGADLFSRLASAATPALIAAGDAEGRWVVEELRRAQDVLRNTARGFIGPSLGYLAWLPVMFLSRRVGRVFTAGSAAPGSTATTPGPTATALPPPTAPPAGIGRAVAQPATPTVVGSEVGEVGASARARGISAPGWRPEPAVGRRAREGRDYASVTELPAEAREELEKTLQRFRGRSPKHGPDPGSPSRQAPRRFERFVQIVLFSWGSLMLLVVAGELAMPRARFVTSSPAPGTTVAGTPAAITVGFGRELDPASSISVVRTITRSPSGEQEFTGGTRVATRSGLGPDDPRRRTLKVGLEPGAPGGLYCVDWRTLPAGGGMTRHGTFYFGVGMPVPDHIAREGPPVRERDDRERRRREEALGGVLLIALGAVLPRLPRRD